jgi:N utilization substance protein A
VVPDHQLSLAIGREGQNARLAARLTGWRIDIKSETQIFEEEAAYADADWAEGEWVTDPETGEQTWVPADGSEAMSADDWVTAAEETAVEDGDVTQDSEQPTNEAAPSEVVQDDESSQEQEEQPTN